MFVSHASGDRLALTGKYLLRFIKEVESRLNSVDPRQGDSRRLFLDRRDIEFGDAWETALQQAVCCSRALLCLVSPRYLISEWCGKELQVFLHRRDDANRDGTSPEIVNWIFPLIWDFGPRTRSLPRVLSQFQYRPPEADDDFFEVGIVGYYRQGRWKAVNKIIDGFVRQLAKMFERQPGGLPHAAGLPAMLRDIRNALAAEIENDPYVLQVRTSNAAITRLPVDWLNKVSDGGSVGSLVFPERDAVADETTSMARRGQILLLIALVSESPSAFPWYRVDADGNGRLSNQIAVLLITDGETVETCISQQNLWKQLGAAECTSLNEFPARFRRMAMTLRRERIGSDPGTAVTSSALSDAASAAGIPTAGQPVLSVNGVVGRRP